MTFCPRQPSYLYHWTKPDRLRRILQDRRLKPHPPGGVGRSFLYEKALFGGRLGTRYVWKDFERRIDKHAIGWTTADQYDPFAVLDFRPFRKDPVRFRQLVQEATGPRLFFTRARRRPAPGFALRKGERARGVWDRTGVWLRVPEKRLRGLTCGVHKDWDECFVRYPVAVRDLDICTEQGWKPLAEGIEAASDAVLEG